MLFVRKLILSLVPLATILYVVFFVAPPKDWSQASTLQVLLIFIPLLLFFTFFVNLFVNYLPKALILGLSSMIMAAFLAIDQLNLLTGGIVIVITVILYKLFPKIRYPVKNDHLTRDVKIPTLTRIGRR